LRLRREYLIQSVGVRGVQNDIIVPGPYPTDMARVVRAHALLIVLLLSIGTFSVIPVPHTNATSGSSYSSPTWWSKFEVVSSPGFTPVGDGSKTKSVSVGPNIDVSNEPGPQSETSISINPLNPKEIVGGSNEIFRLPMRGYFSSDGGDTWGAVDLPLPSNTQNSATNFGSDPGVAWDGSGHVFYSYIVVFFNQNFRAVTATEVAVARSDDGGMTWTATYFGQTTGKSLFNDKPYIAVDTNPTSPHFDRIYVAWDRVVNGNGVSSHNGIMVSYSDDGGASFSTPLAVVSSSGQKSAIGADPFVGPDGTLYVAWHDVFNNELVVSSSSDGSQSFGSVNVISRTMVAFDIDIPPMDTRFALLYPACGADISSGPNKGDLYCSWMDEMSTGSTDIFVSRSTDGGVSWSTPIRLNDDPASALDYHFNQWLSVDPTDGSIHISWYDTRNDPTHLSTDVFYSMSSDGGLTFIKNVQVTTAPTNETCCGANLGNQYGDYEGIAAFGGAAHPFWTDRRTSVASLDEEIFTAIVKPK
jgi:hypothetical protein